jgi:Ca-activated chloride channel family protein
VDPNKPMRLQVVQAATGHFLLKRKERKAGDHIGWIEFDQSARMRQPLDDNIDQAINISQFPPMGGGYAGLGGGTNFEAAIDFTAEKFAEAEKETGITSPKIMVLVTDGEDKLESKVEDRLVDVLVKNKIRLYVIAIGPEVAKAEGASIVRICERVQAAGLGGKVFRLESGDLDKSFDEVDKTEAGPVPVQSTVSRDELFWIPLGIAVLLAVLWQASLAILKGQ